MTSLLSRTDHKAGRVREMEETRGKETERERTQRSNEEDSMTRSERFHAETRATEITDLPDDNPPWCRADTTYGRTPHDC